MKRSLLSFLFLMSGAAFAQTVLSDGAWPVSQNIRPLHAAGIQTAEVIHVYVHYGLKSYLVRCYGRYVKSPGVHTLSTAVTPVGRNHERWNLFGAFALTIPEPIAPPPPPAPKSHLVPLDTVAWDTFVIADAGKDVSTKKIEIGNYRYAVSVDDKTLAVTVTTEAVPVPAAEDNR